MANNIGTRRHSTILGSAANIWGFALLSFLVVDQSVSSRQLRPIVQAINIECHSQRCQSFEEVASSVRSCYYSLPQCQGGRCKTDFYHRNTLRSFLTCAERLSNQFSFSLIGTCACCDRRHHCALPSLQNLYQPFCQVC